MSVSVMSQKSMAQARSLCSTCQVAWAWLGERECGNCLFETRLGLWLLEEHPARVEPSPWGMSVDQALEWATSGVIHPEPRIQECAPPVTMPRRRREEALAECVMAWVGLVALVMFVVGFAMGKFGH